MRRTSCYVACDPRIMALGRAIRPNELGFGSLSNSTARMPAPKTVLTCTLLRNSCRLVLLALAPASFAAPTTFVANDYGAKGDGKTLNTAAIQKAIDAAAAVKGTVTLQPGTYLTGSLFLKSGVTLEVAEGATLVGSEQLKDYPMLPTRIAGIEMTWPSALINVRDQHDVTNHGQGNNRWRRAGVVEVVLGLAREI